jgi:hypothetical protein
MLVKKFNSNEYVYISKNKFSNHSHYYQEIMRIMFNRVQSHNNIIEELQSKLK